MSQTEAEGGSAPGYPVPPTPSGNSDTPTRHPGKRGEGPRPGGGREGRLTSEKGLFGGKIGRRKGTGDPVMGRKVRHPQTPQVSASGPPLASGRRRGRAAARLPRPADLRAPYLAQSAARAKGRFWKKSPPPPRLSALSLRARQHPSPPPKPEGASLSARGPGLALSSRSKGFSRCHGDAPPRKQRPPLPLAGASPR